MFITINRFKYTIKKHLPFLHRWYRKLKKLMNFGRYSKENSKYSIKLFGRDLTYETTLSLLNEADIPFETIYADDINDPSIINKLEMLSCRYVVVSHNNSRDATGNGDLGFVNIDVSGSIISVITCYKIDCKAGTTNKLINYITLE